MSFFHSPSIHRHTDIDTYVHTHTSDRVINSSSVSLTQGFNGIGGLESQITLPRISATILNFLPNSGHCSL